MAKAKAKESRPAPEPSRPAPAAEPASYTVVARRYRPQRFEDVVGQDHVVQSLTNAIRLNKVSHAYLFSGTRGVGKTSVARIFAKCLNCVQGPTEKPCLTCDICQSIAVGQDVDVIEIDGASNNGVEAVRELRQNAGLRPSRARFKIYYIDEVHMLSTGAFNALLKTLEEPPEHVKFFFATTEANKLPITVLSRCQRYEFAGIAPEQIVDTLAEICEREKVEADRDALGAVARRAAGSMRDAQSLLEQLLSVGERKLTLELVHHSLGLAPIERLTEILQAIAAREPGRVLQLFDSSVASGVQPVDLLNGLLEFVRDVMVLAAGADIALVGAPPSSRPALEAIAGSWPLDTILAAQQILAEARSRLRGSPHGRLLVELALVRVSRLENFSELGDVVTRLRGMESGLPASGPAQSPQTSPVPSARPSSSQASGGPAAVRGGSGPSATAYADRAGSARSGSAPARARTAPGENGADVDEADAADTAETAPGLARSNQPLEFEAVLKGWPRVLSKLGARLGMPLSQAKPTAIAAPDVLVIELAPGYNWVAEQCDTPDARGKIEEALSAVLGRAARIRFELAKEDEAPAEPADQAREPEHDELEQKVVELFDARRVRVDTDDS